MYISSGVGAKTKCTPMLVRSSTSCCNVLGYLLRSSGLLNCVGLTNTLTMQTSFSETALRTSVACPSWSAPMVGTSPIVLPCRMHALTWSVSSCLVVTICIIGVKKIKKVCKGTIIMGKKKIFCKKIM